MCAGDVEPSLQKEVQVEQFASRFILWGLEVLYWAVIDDSVALFQIRSNEDKLPLRVVHVVDRSAGLPRSHNCVADFNVQWVVLL